MDELFDIPGYPSYQVTRDGRLWSKRYKMWRKPNPGTWNQLAYVLYDVTGKRRHIHAYQLVRAAGALEAA